MIRIKRTARVHNLCTMANMYTLDQLLASYELNLNDTPIVRVSSTNDVVTKSAVLDMRRFASHALVYFTDDDGIYVALWVFETNLMFMYWQTEVKDKWKCFRYEEIDSIDDLLTEYSDIYYMKRHDQYKQWTKRLRCFESDVESDNDGSSKSGVWLVPTKPLFDSPLSREETECDSEFLAIERRQELE